MNELEIEIVAAVDVRRSFVDPRDIRGDVEFQNDVNALLARVEHLQMPWRSLSALSPAPLASAAHAARPGRARGHRAAVAAHRGVAPVCRRAPAVGRGAPLIQAAAARAIAVPTFSRSTK
jgi:hypothetical protein